MPPANDRGEWILDFIHDFTNEKGYAPTVREITEGVGLKSTSATHYWLESLRAGGAVTWAPGSARTIRITDKRY